MVRSIGWLPGFLLLLGCSAQHVPKPPPTSKPKPVVAADSAPDNALNEVGKPIIIRARHFKERGPCIPLDPDDRRPLHMVDRLVPMVDWFRVTEVVKGELAATHIGIRPRTEKGPDYPKELIIGTTYTLRLKPSERTLRELRRFEKSDYNPLWVDAAEIAEEQDCE
jgi:hypothetical protein